MSLDTSKLLERCVAGQWSINDFDWSQPPPLTFSREKEQRVCYYYANMMYIERMAAALFLALSRRVNDPALRAIYESFHGDELRHSHAAARLMDYFDVHHYRIYTPSRAMTRFIPYFTRLVESSNLAFANSLVLIGELVLDIAFLRALNEYVDDPLARAVVEKINSDESRHVAMDYFMTQYCSENDMKADGGVNLNLLNPDFRGLLRWGPGFFSDVFMEPMQLLDPEQKYMRDVARKIRRFYLRDELKNNPAVKQFNWEANMLDSPLGRLAGGFLARTLKNLFGINVNFMSAGARKNLKVNRGPVERVGDKKIKV